MTAHGTISTEIADAQFYEFLERFFGDLGAVMHAATVLIGDRIGLYRAMAEHGWQTREQIADATGTHARYASEWLAAQAASAYAEYDQASGRFRLSPVQVLALTGGTPCSMLPGGLLAAATLFLDLDVICDAFVTGQGLSWGEHQPDLTEATTRFFRGNYLTNLVPR